MVDVPAHCCRLYRHAVELSVRTSPELKVHLLLIEMNFSYLSSGFLSCTVHLIINIKFVLCTKQSKNKYVTYCTMIVSLPVMAKYGPA